jgi:hypothetical protein
MENSMKRVSQWKRENQAFDPTLYFVTHARFHQYLDTLLCKFFLTFHFSLIVSQWILAYHLIENYQIYTQNYLGCMVLVIMPMSSMNLKDIY